MAEPCEVCGFAKVVCQGDHSPTGPVPDVSDAQRLWIRREQFGGNETQEWGYPPFEPISAMVPVFRACCTTVIGYPHASYCGVHYFAEGQTVTKREGGFSVGPGRVCWGPAQLRIKEDTVSSDRTFENETRPL